MKNCLVVESDGVRLYAETFGDPRRPAVLLIMGAMSSGAWWPEEFCEELAQRGRFVLRYDHRDTGGSTSYEPGKPEYSVEDLADDAIHVLDRCGIAKAHLVGMSLGGFLAQLLALKYPDRVCSLTLISSERLAAADPGMPGISQDVLDYHAKASDLDWNDREAVVDYQLGAWRLLSGSAHDFEADLIRRMAEEDLARTRDPRTAFNHALLQSADGWTDRMDEIRQPALIIHGTEDIVLPYAHAEALDAALPNSKLVTLEGTGHELPRGDWKRVIEEISSHTAQAADCDPAAGNTG